MRDQHQRSIVFARLREQQVHHTRGRSGVQVAGGFIGQQQPGAVHQGARNGHALQLATAQLLGQALAQVGQAHGCQHVLHPIGFGAAQQHERQGYVLRHAEVGQHMKGLKHKPHMGAPPQGALRFIQRRQVGVAMHDAPRIPVVQPRQAVEQGGFAHARVAHDGHKLPRLHRELHVGKHGRAAVVFGQILNV